MEKLQDYLNGMAPPSQIEFATRCGTTIGYLRKAISTRQRLSEGLCLRIRAESAGVVQPADLLPDVDWQYLLTDPSAAGTSAPVGA